MKKLLSSSFILTVCIFSAFSPNSFSKAGDWTSSGGRVQPPMAPAPAPSIPGEPESILLECKNEEPQKLPFSLEKMTIEGNFSKEELKDFKRNGQYPLSVSLNIYYSEDLLSSFDSELSKETKSKDLYKLLVNTQGLGKKDGSYPTGFYFKRSFWKTDVLVGFQTEKGYEIIKFRCQSKF